MKGYIVTAGSRHHGARLSQTAVYVPTVVIHLIAVGEQIPVAVAANELAKLPLCLHGRHVPVVKPIVLPGAREILVGERDAIRIIVHAAAAAAASFSDLNLKCEEKHNRLS